LWILDCGLNGNGKTKEETKEKEETRGQDARDTRGRDVRDTKRQRQNKE